MTYKELVKATVEKQPVYQPGKPIEIVAREYGLDPESIAKLASNENPLGCSPKGKAAANKAISDSWLYPENASFFLKEKLAEKFSLNSDQFTIGAGSSEIQYLLGDLFLDEGKEVVMGKGAFITMKIVALMYGASLREIPLLEDLSHDLDAMRAAVNDNTRIVYLPDPNNPTGTVVEKQKLYDFIRSLPDHVLFVYDEAYVEYRDDSPDLRPLIAEGKKIIGTRTFSKIYGLAGLRIGYSYSDPELASLLDRVRAPFNVNLVAQAAALAALDDEDFKNQSKELNSKGLVQLAEGFQSLGLEYVPSEANFILVKVGESMKLYDDLQKMGFIVRPVGGYGFPEYLRVSVGTKDQNAGLLNALKELLSVA